MDSNSKKQELGEIEEESLVAVTGGGDGSGDFTQYTCKTCGGIYVGIIEATAHYYATDPHHAIAHQE